MRLPASFTAFLATILAAGVVVISAVDKEPAPPATQLEVASVQRAAARAAEITGVVREVSKFVEASRGLAFKRPVKVALLDDKAFAARQTAKAPDAVHEGIDRTLGLIDPAIDHAAYAQAFDPDVVGFYDYRAKELFVRGTQMTAYARYVLAHELTHALQDQHFDLARISTIGVADESDIGLQTLAEGDAMRVGDAFYASLSPNNQRSIDAIEDPERLTLETTTTTTPPRPEPTWPGNRGAEYAALFPYALGPRLVDRLIREGGQGSLDAAFITPPNSSEQLVFYGNGGKKKIHEQPAPVATPAADGVPISEGPFGVAALNTFFYSQWTNVSWPSADWSGGRYVAWRQGDATCVRFSIVMDTGYAAAMLHSNLELIMQFHGQAYVTGPQMPKVWTVPYDKLPNGPVTYTTCGPPKTRNWDQVQGLLGAIYNKQTAEQWRTGGYYGTPPRYTPQPYQPLPDVTWLTNSY